MMDSRWCHPRLSQKMGLCAVHPARAQRSFCDVLGKYLLPPFSISLSFKDHFCDVLARLVALRRQAASGTRASRNHPYGRPATRFDTGGRLGERDAPPPAGRQQQASGASNAYDGPVPPRPSAPVRAGTTDVGARHAADATQQEVQDAQPEPTAEELRALRLRRFQNR